VVCGLVSLNSIYTAYWRQHHLKRK